MSPPKQLPVTQLLNAWQAGDETAREPLFNLIYKDLSRLARRQLQGESSPTLQTTVLVHEAFIRLADQNTDWKSRAQFFFVAAKVMRRIIVDWARERNALKRGGSLQKETIDGDLAAPINNEDLVAIDLALIDLEKQDHDLAQLIEMRFFAGFSMAEIAELTHTPLHQLKTNWIAARTWIFRYIQK